MQKPNEELNIADPEFAAKFIAWASSAARRKASDEKEEVKAVHAKMASDLQAMGEQLGEHHDFNAGDLVQVKAPFADIFDDFGEGEPLVVIEPLAYDDTPERDEESGNLRDIRIATMMGCGHLKILWTEAAMFEPYSGEIAEPATTAAGGAPAEGADPAGETDSV